MSEIEVPLEQTQKDLEEAVHHASQGNWITMSALLSALLAVLAAIAALEAGGQVNQAMMSQMKASDLWAYYQAKGIKASVLETRSQILVELGKAPDPTLQEKLQKYADEQKELQEKAKTQEEISEGHFQRHETFAKAVTFYQIAIAITAIAVLTRRRRFLMVSGAFGVIGIYFLGAAFMT